MGGKTEKLKVNQYDKDGKYIATFDSLNEGLLTATGSLYFMIDFKKKPVSFANGFYWKIDDGDHSDIVPPKRTREDVKGKSLQVNKYDLDGKYIDTFLSLKEAAKSINWKSLNVSVADGSVCYAGGFYWKKEDGDHSDIIPPEKRIRSSKEYEKKRE